MGRLSDLFGADDLFDAGKLFDAVDHPLLSLWGKPGREHIRRLCELGDEELPDLGTREIE